MEELHSLDLVHYLLSLRIKLLWCLLSSEIDCCCLSSYSLKILCGNSFSEGSSKSISQQSWFTANFSLLRSLSFWTSTATGSSSVFDLYLFSTFDSFFLLHLCLIILMKKIIWIAIGIKSKSTSKHNHWDHIVDYEHPV